MSCSTLEVAASKLLLGLISALDLPDVAADALEDGFDSPSLRLLAGSTESDVDETRPLLAQALAEMDCCVPNRHAAVMCLAREISKDLLAGTVGTHEGATTIWEITLRVPEESFPELDTFIYAASEWDERPEDQDIFDAGIIAAARELLDV